VSCKAFVAAADTWCKHGNAVVCWCSFLHLFLIRPAALWNVMELMASSTHASIVHCIACISLLLADHGSSLYYFVTRHVGFFLTARDTLGNRVCLCGAAGVFSMVCIWWPDARPVPAKMVAW
jgi:hypothetical protein